MEARGRSGKSSHREGEREGRRGGKERGWLNIRVVVQERRRFDDGGTSALRVRVLVRGIERESLCVRGKESDRQKQGDRERERHTQEREREVLSVARTPL